MKRNRSRLIFNVTAGLMFATAIPNVAVAQNMQQIVDSADVKARGGNWEEAYPLYKQATELHSPEKLVELFDNAAAYLWYRRGQGAQVLAKKGIRLAGGEAAKIQAANALYQDAIAAYDKCTVVGETTEQNKFKNQVIYLKGQCQMALGQYDAALESWALFQKNFNSTVRDEQHILQGKGRGKFILDQSISHLKKGEPDLESGKKGLKWLMQPENKTKFRIPDAAIVLGFKALCDATKVEVGKVADDLKKKGELERGLIAFMNENRNVMTLLPYQMYVYTPNFLKLALDMKDLGLDRASFVIQSFLPNTTVSKEDMELKLSELGSLDQMVDYYDLVKKNGITSDLGKLSGEVEKGKPHEMTQNLVMAQYYENEGNSRAAFGVYEMIELYHSDHPEREDLLFNLVRTAYNIGEIFKTNDYGQIFLKDFPKSSHVPNVEEFMLISLFQNGKYERCIEVANKLLSTLTEGTKQHDTALYCLGGSLFYSAQLDLAREPLSKHVALYGKGGKHKESPNAKATQYWEASNETYLQQWEIAAPKLDKFLADYPKPEENSYFPSAMYDRANCHTQLNQEEESIKCLDVIIKNHTDDPVIDRSYSLRGNNHQTLGDFNSAFQDYQVALKLARRAKNDSVEEEVLNNLVIFLGDKNQPAANDEQKAQRDANYKAAVQYYDEFWKKFSGGNYKAIVAVTGIPSLTANGRGEEALANLKEVIMKLASVENAPDMDKAINSYTEEYLMIHNGDAEKLKQHYLDDFQVMGNNVYALSLVKMSLVDAYETLKKNAQRDRDQGATDRWTRAIDATLKELANLPLDKLNNFTLVSIGDNIRKGAETDVAFKQASRFYRQAIENAKSGKEVSFKNEAIFGLAIVVVETGEQDKLAEAFQDLTNLRDNENTDKKTKQKAHLQLVHITFGLAKHDDAIKEAKSFIGTYPNSASRTAVRFTLANAYYEKGDKDEALRHYESVLGASPGVIKFSGPAILRAMEITKDPFVSWKAGSSYVGLVEESFNNAVAKGQMSNKEKDYWQEIQDVVDKLSNDPAVSEGIKREEIENEARERFR